MNPNAKPVTPKTSKGIERDLMRFLAVYRAAVEDEDNQFATLGRDITPLGTDFAAEKTGRSVRYIQNTLNPTNHLNPPGLREFFRLWRCGLDVSVMAELLRGRRMVAIALPEEGEYTGHAPIAAHGCRLAKEVGDVFSSMEAAFAEAGAGGAKVTLSECDQFERECLEVIPALMVLIDDMRREVSCR